MLLSSILKREIDGYKQHARPGLQRRFLFLPGFWVGLR